MSCSSISHRSSSLKLPLRSSTSRISSVVDDASLEPKIDVMYGTTNNAQELGWFDHLLGVFCVSRRSKSGLIPTTVSAKQPENKDREVRNQVNRGNDEMTKYDFRATSILGVLGSSQSTSFRLKGTNTEITYPKKPSVPLTLAICKAILYQGPFSSTCWVTRRQTSTG